MAHRRLPNTVTDASAGIEVHGRDVPSTARALAEASQSLLGYLRGEHADRLRTDTAAVEPETQQVKGQPGRITGYAGRTTVSFRAAPDAMPALLAGSLGHGGNTVQQAGSSPREDETAHARNELAAEATRAAMVQAAAVAGAAGQHVTGVREIVVDGEPGRVMPMRAMRADAAPMPVAVEAGESDVTVGVSVKVRAGP